ncbi:MAG: class I SAM-dependent methyltransferase [Polyangiales bacterium]
MGWWFAPFYDKFMRRSEEAGMQAWRHELLEGVRGEVLDVGAGTGANLPHFDPRTTRVIAAEPDPLMARRLRTKSRGLAHVEVVDAPAEEMPFADRAFDVVVATLVLCTVRDLDRSLREIRRVLRPGGKLVFLEHVADDERLRTQRIVEPVWRAIAGGCHLTRRTDESIARCLTVVTLTREEARAALPVVRTCVRGVAVKE